MHQSLPTILIIGGGVSRMQSDVLFGACACARERGWTAISEQIEAIEMIGTPGRAGVGGTSGPDAQRAQVDVEQLIREWRPQSVLVAFGVPELVARVASLAPTVAAMTYTDGIAIPSIDVDQSAVVMAAAEHLFSLGLRNFAAIGNWSLPWAVERVKHFVNRARAAGFECHVSGGQRGEPPMTGVDTVGEVGEWLASLPKPVGIFAASDHVGKRLASHCLALGVRVPEDVAIIGIDNDDVTCKMSKSPLSSVAINWHQIGYEAAEMAGRLAEGKRVEPTRKLVGPAGVVIRKSTELLAVEDPEIAEALRIIREHADRPLTVSQILRKLPIDRNRLEHNFRKFVGRRILQEVRRVHVEHAKGLLSSSDLPMPTVAERSGFTNASTFSSVFRSETGQTPSEYRRNFRLLP